MSTQRVESVLSRLTTDKAFRMQYCKDPDGTLSEYLSVEEIRHIKTGDHHSLDRSDTCSRLHALSAELCGSDPGP